MSGAPLRTPAQDRGLIFRSNCGSEISIFKTEVGMKVSEHCKFNLDGVGLRTGRQSVPVAINQVLSQGNQIMLTEWKWGHQFLLCSALLFLNGMNEW